MRSVPRRAALAAALAAPFARFPATSAQEGAWAPSRPVRVLVSTVAAGGSDTAARR